MSVEDNYFSVNRTIRVRDKLLLMDEPWVMGIINCTPDSFYENSRYQNLTSVLAVAEQQISEGAKILDLGGYSSRPGAASVSTADEITRTAPAIAAIRKAFPDVLISIDTFRSDVAQAALEAGADIINDISGGSIDPKIWDVAARFKAPYILMHMRGTPETMQSLTEYSNLFTDLVSYFSEKIQQLHALGVHDIILDPGFGFAKTLEQNYELLRALPDFRFLHKPMLVGVSRKSMIYKKLGTTPHEALNGTTVLNTLALERGAAILRVHDVREAIEAVRLTEGFRR